MISLRNQDKVKKYHEKKKKKIMKKIFSIEGDDIKSELQPKTDFTHICAKPKVSIR
jgi:hypothetical protein